MACRAPVVPGGDVGVIGRFLLVAALLLVAPAARAQGNYRSAALGGRSALMGDTGIALGTDGAAPFLNPATTVQVQSTLAVSMSFLTLDVQHASDWYAPGADVTRVSGNAIPSTLCFFFGLPRLYTPHDKSSDGGRQKLAACFGNTELQSFDWVGQGFRTAGTPGNIETTSVHWAWQRFVVGPSYAVNVTPSLALGASVLGAFTNYSSFASVSQTTTDGSAWNAFQEGASGNDFALGAALGATLHLSRFTLGAMIQSPDVSVYGRGNASDFQASSTGSSTYFGRGSFHVREPTRFGLGVGYSWPHGAVELDGQLALGRRNALDLHTSGTRLDTPGGAPTAASLDRSTRFAPIVNWSLGAEVFVRPTLSILGGFATDLSAVDGLAQNGLAPDEEDRVLVSLGLGTHSPSGSVIIGAQGYYGWGQMLGYAQAPRVTPVDFNSTGVLFVLAGATNLKSIKNAVEEVRKIVSPSGQAK